MRAASLTFSLALAALSACDPEPEAPRGDAPAGGKADAPGVGPSSAAPDAGSLAWSQLSAAQGLAGGLPLLVSNNPEHVQGFGVLAAVPRDGVAIGESPRKTGAPSPRWEGGVLDPACPNGGMRHFGVYLAHIVGSELGGDRKVSLALAGDVAANVKVTGEIGTTDWSDSNGYKTVRTDWLGARLAKSFMRGESPSSNVAVPAGGFVVVATQASQSLVEGRFEIESDQCVYPYTVAHTGALTQLPEHYAAGDVKWPGWFNGQGYGRAAGVYEGDELHGKSALVVTDPNGIQGIGLLAAGESMKALGHHADSADILFGNYGVTYDYALDVANETGECIEAHVEIVAYPDRDSTSDRTPAQSFFNATGWSSPPTMFWNGPVAASDGASNVLHHPVLRHRPTDAEKAAPTTAMQSMRHELATVRLEDGDEQQVALRFPVPGYIVAPIALTVDSDPCR